ncbi:DDE-type integrase/transposase/recombinase [Bartonella sp. HY761]|uniref:DDE-type integrase/transposase/recombinase n=1 Tax=Bartonella sp. HY761 TaxID=2979330 RepID=UPI00220C85E7|nr:DDE-type integrase/transposase/recombinase [Bartonella sp. HY761]UXN07542.1 DDE-type integrase/transposase/recombinase [Bartonella sp. HY761]
MKLFQEYLSAQEIADAAKSLGLKVVPHTKRGVQLVIIKNNWDASPLCRKREGSQGGGGNEYHYSLLPLALQTALQLKHTKDNKLVAAENAKAQDVAVIERMNPTALSARQRDIMHARAGVLHHINLRMIENSQTQRSAILSFLSDMTNDRLPANLHALAMKANDKGRGLSRGTISRWFVMRDNGGLPALAPKKTREKDNAPLWLKDFLSYYRQPQKPSIAQAFQCWCKDNGNAILPSLRQVRHAVSKLTEIEKQRGRMGPNELKTLKAFKARDVSDLLPASVYVADGKTFDAEIAHPLNGQPFRPELTTIIDAHSRKIVGWSAALDENAHAVIDALLMAARTCGIPAIFYSDNGPGYKNQKMEDGLTGFLARLSITPSHATPYNSQAKGVIENFNKRWTSLAREMPTYIGRDMDKQAGQLVHKTTRKELRLSGVSSLLPKWQQFLDCCQNLIDDYNNTPQRSLEKNIDPQNGKRRHMTPNEVWARAIANGFEPYLVDDIEARDLLQPWVIRKTRRGLVDWLGNSYFAMELEPYHGQEVIVAYDIHDAGQVVVRDITLLDDERKPGKLIAIARFEGHKTRYVPLSFEQAAMEKRHKGRKDRAMRKVNEIDNELRAISIDSFVEPMPIIDRATATLPRPILVADNDVQKTAPTSCDQSKSKQAKSKPAIQKCEANNKRPNFRDDAEYCVWLLNNPERVTLQDQINIREDLLATKHNMTFLARQGINLDALAKLSRSAA